LELGARFSASERLHIACSNRIVLGIDCLLGSGVHITDHNHGNYKGAAQSHPDVAPIVRPIVSGGPVVIGDRVWIGDNCVIIGSVKIGEGAVIAANSVAGAPARVIKLFDSVRGEWERTSQLSGDGHQPPLVSQ
jgi:lipopolysaccharide O-acetyltransferase